MFRFILPVTILVATAREASTLGQKYPFPTTRTSHPQPFPCSSRREWLSCAAAIGVPLLFVDPAKTNAEDGVIAAAATTTPLEMKLFVDPLFVVSVPKPFFTLRRTQKGDLPDAKTGKGRRGSSIFTAGNMAKAEVIAVEVSWL
jgi:hypothetical protein